MKRLHEWTLGMALMVLALVACTNEAELLPDVPPTNEPAPTDCVLKASDFRWEEVESRTSLEVTETAALFSWTPGDLVGVLPDDGAQVYFKIPEAAEVGEGGETTDDDARLYARFDGGAWALKADNNYAAYYPFIKDFDISRTAIPVDYTGQVQTGNANTAHLAKSDFMGARPVQKVDGQGLTFDFDHVGALVELSFTVPAAGTALKSVTLKASSEVFTLKGSYDLTSEQGFPIAATEEGISDAMTIGLNYTTTEDNETVKVYFMCAPVDLSEEVLNVSVAYGEGENAGAIEFEAVGKNLQAGHGSRLKPKPIPYLTFSAASAQTFKMTLTSTDATWGTFEYSVGSGEWTTLTADIAINGIGFGGEGNDLRLRGNNPTGTGVGDAMSKSHIISFTDDNVKVACTGDIRTLVDGENYATADTKDARFSFLFYECSALKTAPELPATTLADKCYNSMFSLCTSLTAAPALPATTLVESCYYSMFYGCTSLTAAPALPATTLAQNCYNSMFYGCTSLTAAPALPATTLAVQCYRNMFYGCTNLSSVTMLATDISASGCLYSWLKDVAITGTFTKAASLAQGTGTGKIPTGESGIPSGWEVVDYTESE